MRKFFGTSSAARAAIPEAKRAVGVEGDEEFFGEYFNQALYETQTDYIIGTTTQLTTGLANVKIGTGSTFLDADGAAVVFAQGDRIAIIGHDALDADLAFTANDLVFMMNPGVTIDQNSAYKTTISGLNCRGNLNFSNAFASSIVVGDTTSLLDIQTDLDGSVFALGDVVINGNLYNDGNHENLLYGCYEVAQRGTTFTGATTGYHLDGDYNVITNTVTISQETSGAPIGSGHYVKYLYGAAASKCDSAQALVSEIVETVKGKTITGSVLVRCGGSFAADLVIKLQRNGTANTMTGGPWTDIASTTLANANIPTGTTSADWALISVTADITDSADYNGLRWFVEPSAEPSASGASGEFFCLAQPQLHVGSVVRPYVARDPEAEFMRAQVPYEIGGYNTLYTAAVDQSGNLNLTIPFATRKKTGGVFTIFSTQSGTAGFAFFRYQYTDGSGGGTDDISVTNVVAFDKHFEVLRIGWSVNICAMNVSFSWTYSEELI